MEDKVRRELLATRRKAEASVARIKDAELREEALAESEGRDPCPVEPLTEANADSIAAAIQSITGTVQPATADVIGVWRKSMAFCKGRKVNVRSDQLLAVLDAAGIKEGTSAPVHG